MNDALAWPVVSPSDIGIADFQYDLAYMGVYARLEICNYSPYLVREATIRINGRGPGMSKVVTSRDVTVGPLFPGVRVHAEQGIGAQGGIGGLSFDTVSAAAVRLTPPSEMKPAGDYPGLLAEIVDVTTDEEAPDIRPIEDEWTSEARVTEATTIRVRVRNTGLAVVERARLKLVYYEDADAAAGGQAGSPVGVRTGPARDPVAEWILDMPRQGWDPYRLPPAPQAVCEPANPLPPGQAYEFTVVHYGGGPPDWLARADATSVEVCEVRVRL